MSVCVALCRSPNPTPRNRVPADAVFGKRRKLHARLRLSQRFTLVTVHRHDHQQTAHGQVVDSERDEQWPLQIQEAEVFRRHPHERLARTHNEYQRNHREGDTHQATGTEGSQRTLR